MRIEPERGDGADLPRAGQEPEPGLRAYAALVILSAIVGLNTVDRNMFGLLLPQIQQDIALSDTALGFLMGPAFVIVYSLMGVPLAWLADRTGRRTIIVVGLAFWSVVTMATGLARSFGHLVVARMALGVGEASNMAPTSALIADMFQGRRRVFAMAIFSAGGPLAIMLCYPLIGWIAQEHGWRPAFPLMGLIGLAIAALSWLIVREPKAHAPPPETHASSEKPLAIGEALALAARSPAFWLVTAGGTMVSINYSALLAWLPTFMLRVHGYDAAATGALLGTYKGLIGVAATIAGGLLVTWLMRFDRRWLAWSPAAFCLIMAPAQALMVLADAPLWWQLGLAVETIMMAAITPALFALVLALFTPRMRATGTAMYLLIFNLVGQSAGPVLIGLLNDGPLARLGDDAVRFSLLAAPMAIVAGSLLLFALARHIQPEHQA
jgi:MFS family permease